MKNPIRILLCIALFSLCSNQSMAQQESPVVDDVQIQITDTGIRYVISVDGDAPVEVTLDLGAPEINPAPVFEPFPPQTVVFHDETFGPNIENILGSTIEITVIDTETDTGTTYTYTITLTGPVLCGTEPVAPGVRLNPSPVPGFSSPPLGIEFDGVEVGVTMPIRVIE